MLKYLLDTNACIIYIKFPNSKVRAKLLATPAAEIGVSSIVKYEMYYGSLKSSDPVRSLKIQDSFLGQFESLPFDDEVCLEAARIRADLSKVGMMIGAYDILIAATAITKNLTLIIHNLSEFNRIAGLKIEDWEA